jgi:hypothetical protein
VPLHHAQSLWDIRQSPNLYQVFKEFFGTPRLLVDINRCMFRPPKSPAHPGVSHATIHWDVDPRLPQRASLQGVVLLSDISRDGGGFQCLPETYQDLDAWLDRNARRDDFDFMEPGLSRRNASQVEGKAGVVDQTAAWKRDQYVKPSTDRDVRDDAVRPLKRRLTTHRPERHQRIRSGDPP